MLLFPFPGEVSRIPVKKTQLFLLLVFYIWYFIDSTVHTWRLLLCICCDFRFLVTSMEFQWKDINFFSFLLNNSLRLSLSGQWEAYLFIDKFISALFQWIFRFLQRAISPFLQLTGGVSFPRKCFKIGWPCHFQLLLSRSALHYKINYHCQPTMKSLSSLRGEFKDPLCMYMYINWFLGAYFCIKPCSTECVGIYAIL